MCEINGGCGRGDEGVMNGDAKLPPKGKTIPETGLTCFALISLQIA